MEKERLRKIYEKTDGHCHICHSSLVFASHGKHNTKGAWHIEHSKPKSKGGTDHLNNLLPACIPCNLTKGVKHTKIARAKHGHTRAPLSKVKKQDIQGKRIIVGGIVGGIFGIVGGPLMMLVGIGVGASAGSVSSKSIV